MGNNAAVNYEGKIFANNWEVIKKYSCKEYREIYIQQTGDESKIIKNCHYLCRNNGCGVETFMEASTLKRNLDRDILTKCKGCNPDICFYKKAIRVKNPNQIIKGEQMKVPEREEKLTIGKTYGFFTLLSYTSSGDFEDHQRRAKVRCSLCKNELEVRVNSLLDESATCSCFKKRSSGEMLVKTILEKHNIPFDEEYIFDCLKGEGGGNLRYDFVILNNKNEPCGFIEFDGEQHFQEAGSYFNPTGRVQRHDNKKNNYLIDIGIPLLRIAYNQKDKAEELILDFYKKI